MKIPIRMRSRRPVVTAFALALALASPPSRAHAQAPAWSRGEQKLRITWDECRRRADAALGAEGFSVGTGNSFAAGQKGIHSAIITCNDAGNGEVWVNVFVASASNDGGVPGYERVRLQRDMDTPSASATSGTTLYVTGVAGWTAVWTRRGTGNTWDGIWTRGAERVTTVMEGGIQQGQLYLRRVSSSDGVLCESRGTVAADGQSVSGIQSCPGHGESPWSATIVSGAESPSASATSGTTLYVTGVAGWTAVWTRRGTGNTWDGIWTRGAERVTTVMEGGIQQGQLYLRRVSSSDGILCESRGTVAADGRSVSGIQSCPGHGESPWSATIEYWRR